MAKNKFQKGNTLGKGRPKGSRNKGLLLFEKILENDLDSITDQLVALAKSGDMSAISLIINRVYSLPPKASSMVDLPLMNDIKTQTDVNNSMTDLLSAVGSGDVDIEEAKELAALIKAKSESIHICMANELQELKNFVSGTKDCM